MEWLTEFWQGLTVGKILFGVGMFVLSLGLSFAAIAVVLVKIPAEYFSPNYTPEFMPGKPWYMRYSAIIVKNIFGAFLILLGILLSLPGVPGQGILTILLGLIMLDIPGKRPLEAKIISRPNVLAAANKLRERFDKPPLVME